MNKKHLEDIREKFRNDEYAITDHAIAEARKDGIEPNTIIKLEWVAIHGKIIEDHFDRERILLYAELPEDKIPVHIVIEYSFQEEPVIVTSYVPDRHYWIKDQIRKK